MKKDEYARKLNDFGSFKKMIDIDFVNESRWGRNSQTAIDFLAMDNLITRLRDRIV